MDFKKTPLIGDIDFNDPDKRKSSIRICIAGIMLFLVLIVIIIKPHSSSEQAQPAEPSQNYESLDVPMGQDRDRLAGKTIRDVSSRRRGRAGAYAEDLFSDDIASKDPLAALSGKSNDTPSASPLSDEDSQLPGFLRGGQNKNIYPEPEPKTSTATQNEQQPASRPGEAAARATGAQQANSSGQIDRTNLNEELTSGKYPGVEAKRRALYEAYGLDPNTGHSVATPTPPPAIPGVQSPSDQGASSSGTVPAEQKNEEPAIEPVKVQVRRSGGVSSFGSSGTELSNLGEQDEFVTDDPSHPFKVKFAYDEKVSSGQRVTIRLCEDMVVDGVLIPVNTHLFATCSVGERLKLNISSIDINGKIYTLNYTAYDNDGAEGLYCPQSEGSQIAKQIGQEAGQIAQSAISSAITGYPSRIFQSGAQIVRSKGGKVTVSVTAGYTFYLMKSK